MASRTKIEWVRNPDGTPGETWNPVTGCAKVSPGCDNCYAETIATRFAGSAGFPDGFAVTLRPELLGKPLTWRKPKTVFVNSMSDLWHDEVPDAFIAAVWATMFWTSIEGRPPAGYGRYYAGRGIRATHTYLVLTKRHGRMRSWVRRWGDRDERMAMLREAAERGWADKEDLQHAWLMPAVLPNVWLGLSVEDQKRADLRTPVLLDTPAAVRWLSCEPLLGQISLWPRYIHDPYDPDGECTACGIEWLSSDAGHPVLDEHNEDTGKWCDGPIKPYAELHWVVVGGESGPRARPAHPDWLRSLRDQCQVADVPFFLKQHGEFVSPIDFDDSAPWNGRLHQFEDGVIVWRVGKKAAGRTLDGRLWDQYPTA